MTVQLSDDEKEQIRAWYANIARLPPAQQKAFLERIKRNQHTRVVREE